MFRLTILFLIALRLTIGWHFFFEGLNKVRTTNIGVTDNNKPFSSEAYFREAEGPLGPKMRAQIGDPDVDAIAKLTLRKDPTEEDKKGGKFHEWMPLSLELEFDGYHKRFLETYPLDESQKEVAKARLTQAKDETVRWILEGRKEVTKKAPGGTADIVKSVSTPERIAEYKTKLLEIRNVYDKLLPAMGKDVEKAHLRTLKSEATTMRNDLLKDLDEQTTKLKDSLTGLIRTRLTGFVAKIPDRTQDEAILEMLRVNGDTMPKALESQWDDWFAYYTQYAGPKLDEAKKKTAMERLAQSKVRFVRFIQDRDEFSGEPLPNAIPEKLVKVRLGVYQDLLTKYKVALNNPPAKDGPKTDGPSEADLLKIEIERTRKTLEDDLRRETEIMKTQVADGWTENQEKGYVSDDVKTEKPIDQLDRITRWTILGIGALLLVGFFTRLACLAGAGFLIMTYLAHPPLPYLPASPMNEGTYLYINKNVVEMFALLTLATTASGRWFGLDSLVYYIFFNPPKNRRI